MSGESAESAEVEIPRAILEAIYRQARDEFPKECCGFLIGQGEDTQLVACENWQDRYHGVDPETYPRTAETAYTFGGKDLRRMAESFDSPRPTTIVYHSHPRVGAYFSDEDARAALSAGWPVDYLVVDAQDDRVVEALLFRRVGDQFQQIARFSGD
ncbi:Mov34/MPN/PAD-1 family protein [Pseudenhygromyxa sp. WMMC2535]|uniref:Mov34/MPN/PAD-1 family protein n=1 Tax=Pseudenhygromyxa sp. WMMC2535 TaxID=2712867 RepID=UPI00155685AA|nr:Mov34/MPN/PAD-1 family protein [Pseudenhygromyxa sp. WMMC2535]NVB41871.1 Mov34/MPN/PAD-1 family protein [Pseudenhygromyxa sp. WMMC2535]